MLRQVKEMIVFYKLLEGMGRTDTSIWTTLSAKLSNYVKEKTKSLADIFFLTS